MKTKSSNLCGFPTSRDRVTADTLRAMALDRERGARIKELRNAHGYRQQWVADQIGISLRGYQFWEEGKSRPEGDNLTRLAKVLQTTKPYIIRGDVPAPDLMGSMNGDALARLERIENSINQLGADHALILECVAQLQGVIEQLGALGVLTAVSQAADQEASQEPQRARTANRRPVA